MSTLNFDARTVTPDTGTGDPIPSGWYNVMVDESEVKPTKGDTGGLRLAVRFTVMDGQYAGRKIFTGFNIKNANPTAQEISLKQLSALAHAVGVLVVEKSEQLHGIPLKVRVKVKPASGDYDASNDITAYRNINEATPGTTGGDSSGGVAAPVAAPVGFGALAPVAAPVAAPAAAGFAAQPWAGGGAPAPVVAPVVAPVAAPVVAPVQDSLAKALADGWQAHPAAAGYYWKGEEAILEADVRKRYEAPAAAVAPTFAAPPAVVAAVAAPAAAPVQDNAAAAASVATPPWQTNQPG